MRSRWTMSRNEAEESLGTACTAASSRQSSQEDPLADTRPLTAKEIPQGVDRRGFLMRSAVGGAAAVMTGCSPTAEEKTAKAVATTPSAASKPDSTPPA